MSALCLHHNVASCWVPVHDSNLHAAAMEVSGIEGNFRHTCESVMRVLRGNKDSVMAMLEAFVHDPLINWRLLNTNEGDPESALAGPADTNGAPRGPGSTCLGSWAARAGS